MNKQNLIRQKQKEVLAEFYCNFALAWFSFGLISPIFNKIEDINKLILGIIVSLGGGILSLILSFSTIKSIYEI